VPPAAKSLLEAALRDPGPENRLTELLATAISEHQGFAVRLAEAVDVPNLPSGTSASCASQVITPEGRFVDLEIALWHEDRVTRRIWCENKIHAAFQPEQLPDYLEALQRIDPDGVLVVIAPESRRAGIEAHAPEGTCFLSWQRVAEEAHAAGREVGEGWSDAETRPSSATQRLLEEFVEYMQNTEDLGVMIEPLRIRHAVALRDAREAMEIAQTLMDRAVERSSYESKRSAISPDGSWAKHRLRPTEHGSQPWGSLEVMRVSRDWIREDATGEAVYVAGITLGKEHADLRTGERYSGWREKIAREGFGVITPSSDVHVMRPLYLVDLATRSPTFDGQCQELAEWLDESLEWITVAEHAPPDWVSQT